MRFGVQRKATAVLFKNIGIPLISGLNAAVNMCLLRHLKGHGIKMDKKIALDTSIRAFP